MDDLLADDQTTVDHAASQVPSVIEALHARIPEARRASLDREISAIPGGLDRWMGRAGDFGPVALAAWCRRELAAMPKYRAYSWPRMAWRLRLVIRQFANQLVGPWVWAELLLAVPSHKRTAAEYLARLGEVFTDNAEPAIRAAIRGKASVRGQLFQRLHRAGRLTTADALAGLSDPPLRETSEQVLRDRVAEVEDDLRDRLDGASAGTREAIVRLLRALDARVDSTGKISETNLGELETRLRASPDDAVTAQVWADLLQEEGDPRGQIAALDIALSRETDPERALAMSEALARVVADHRKAVFGKPGGFPFREKYRGRGFIQFTSSWRGLLRGKPPKIFDKVMAFLGEATTIARPTPDIAIDTAIDDLDDKAFRAHCLGTATQLSASFQLAWPGTTIALPYQEPGHYPEGFVSELRVVLATGKLALTISFPFESFTAPGFARVHQQVADTLGKSVLAPSGFSLGTPTVDGKKIKYKLQRYRGPR